MLRLVNISKIYKAASNDVKALNGVSINFRKNEFVSILGPSGSGKTTLLNIIGGLDKYTDGDLIIAGRSTKDYKDRDWDFYRNQRIGFIFQSYNLIPHQSVLANVELALTISGISKAERIERAKVALDKVGLSDQYDKKPNQLSGGQCQRVAIARALVNNPEILLADEPTGALDTKTSEQIMQLIKEISKDRLVIMVTHNPDLAERYSSRIINLLDGNIVEDSNPFDTNKEIKEVEHLDEAQKVKSSKAKMGLVTANKLSFRNLVSKKGRTILVSIASSIGIIGVSTVLAVSFGVTNYVTNMQDDMLSSYPLEIAEKSIDTTALLSGLSSSDKKAMAEYNANTEVGVQSMIEYLMDKYGDLTKISTNDINETLIQYIKEIPSEYLSATQYNYGIDVTNNIFTHWTASKDVEHEEQQWVSLNGLTQRYIAELGTVNGFENYATFVNLFTNFMKEMPGDEQYITSQYDMLGNSKFATEANEMMLVLEKDRTITDLTLGQLGIYPHDSFINIGKMAVEIYKRGTKADMSDWGLKQRLQDDPNFTQEDYDRAVKHLEEDVYPHEMIYQYDELIGREFYYLPHGELWSYDTQVSSDTVIVGGTLFFNEDYIYNLRYDSTYAKINGKRGFDILSGDEININNPSQSRKVLFARYASESRDPDTFFDDKTFVASTAQLSYLEKYSWFEITSINDFISKFVSNPFEVLTGRGLIVDTQNKAIDIYSNIIMNPNPSPDIEFREGTGTNVVIDSSVSDTVTGYSYQVKDQDIASNPKAMKMKITGILVAKEETNFGSLQRGAYYTPALSAKYMEDAIDPDNAIINDPIHGFKAAFSNGSAATTKFGAYCKFSYLDFSEDDTHPTLRDTGYAYALNGDLSNSIASLFSSIFGGVTMESNNVIYLRALSGLRADRVSQTSLEYEFKALPNEIMIYPKDFNAKDKVTEYLDRWNSEDTLIIGGEEVKKSERKDLSYTDTVAMIISVINALITIVTSALVAFTSLSLVVSCFMIAVITYISVMERVKEIGVIRALGGRKKDVSRLFTAENFMTGLASGLIGITVTYFLSIVINVVVSFFGAPHIASLPWWCAILMVGLSIFLNVISGFIPSKNAAKQDPVNALRSE